MPNNNEKVTIEIKGPEAELGLVPSKAIGRVLVAVYDLNRTAYEVAKWGRTKSGSLSDEDRKLSRVLYERTRPGSVVIDLLVPVLAHHPTLFGDTPGLSIPQVWIQAIKFLLERTKGMIGQLSMPGLQVSPSINIQENYAPIIIQTSASGHNHIQDLVRPIKPGSIDSVKIVLPEIPEGTLALGPTERDLLLNSSLSIAADSEFTGFLIRFDIRKLTGLVEMTDGIKVYCDFVFPDASELKHLMNELCSFKGRPHYVEALGQRSLHKYTVLAVTPADQGNSTA